MSALSGEDFIIPSTLETPADGRCASPKPIMNLLRLCISRSGNLPLSIYVCSTLDDGDGSQGFMKAIANRVENMTLTFWWTDTHLRLGLVSARQAISLVSYCPRLIEIHYKINSSLLPDPGPGTDHCCKHENLRKLVFIFESGTNINAIMNYILPKLTFLQLEIEHTSFRDDSLSMDCLKNFLELSKCRLLHRELTRLNHHSGELQNILKTPVCLGLTTLKHI